MRDAASIANAVSENEPITLAEARRCIKWLQGEYDRKQNEVNKLRGTLYTCALKLMRESDPKLP